MKSTDCLTLAASEDPLRDTAVSSQQQNDDEGCLYFLQTIENLITYCPREIWASLETSITLPVEEQRNQVVTNLKEDSTNFRGSEAILHDELARICLTVLEERLEGEIGTSKTSTLRQVAANVLQQLFQGPASPSVLRADAAEAVTKALMQSVRQSDTVLQISLMGLILVILRARKVVQSNVSQPSHRRATSGETLKGLSGLPFPIESTDKEDSSVDPPAPPPLLIDCLLLGLSSPDTFPVLDSWVEFLDECLPFYAGIAFQILMPLVECFNKTIRSVFRLLCCTFDSTAKGPTSPEPLTTLTSLLNGLDRALARAHERLVQHEAGTISIKTPEQPQGFFGNMVSGVFAPETNRTKSTILNNRLTVLLCFKDAVHICFDIWTWGDHATSDSLWCTHSNSGSFKYTSIRLKNRSRRILEHLFSAEPLECLETLVQLWQKSDRVYMKGQPAAVLNVLHTLEVSRPKNTIPAIFNAMYSRTNPNALDPGRKSSLTSNLSDIDIAGFLIAYMHSLEDDAMDEVWSDCMTFLRDVLGNPLPHRQTLPRLLEFTAILGQKVDNTNFGEQRGMRRDLGVLLILPALDYADFSLGSFRTIACSDIYGQAAELSA